MTLRKKFLSMVLAVSLLFSLVGVASADLGPQAQATAYARMAALKLAAGVLQADGTVSPALDQDLTRAQMVTIIVRAFGKEQEAMLLKGVTLFPDVPADHWASGYITVAKKLADEKNIVIGRPGGTFDPEAKVTGAEVVAFIMKFLGVAPDTTKSWPMDYIQGARSAGMISQDDADLLALIGSNSANRGLAFALADGIFYGYKGLPGNQSVYTTYVDTTGPVITVTSVLPETTEEETVTISGTVDADTNALFLEDQQVLVSATGSFSVDANLSFGTNILRLRAQDLAGNTTTETVSVERLSPTPIATGPLVAEVQAEKMTVGTFERVQLTAIDTEGEPIPEGVTWSTDDENALVTGSGVFQSPVPGRYVVRATVGSSTSFVTISVYGAPAGLKIEATDTVANGISKKPVTVTAVDANGVAVENFGGNGEKVSLSGTGVTIFDADGVETSEVTASNGSANFLITVESYLAGEYFTLTAIYDDGQEEIEETAEFEALVPTAAGLKAEGPTFLAANTGMATPEGAIKVWVVDQDGAPVFDSFDVEADITGPADLIDESAVYLDEESPATFRISNYNHVGLQGKIALRFTVDGVGSTTLTITQLIAGSPTKFEVKPEKSTVKSTEIITFTVTAQDSNGVPVSLNSSTDLTITLPDKVADKFILPEFDPEIEAGESSTTFEIEAEAAFLGDLEVKVQNSNASMVGRGTVTIVADAVDTVAFDRSVAYVPLAAPSATFYGFLSDRLENPVVVANRELEVYVQDVGSVSAITGDDTNRVTINGRTTSSDKPLVVETNAEGKVELKVVAAPQSDKIYMIRLHDDETGETNYAYMLLVNTVPSELKVTTYKLVNSGDEDRYFSTTRVEAGEKFWVKVSVLDNYGGPVMDIEDDLKIVSDEIFSNGTTLVDGESFDFRDYEYWENADAELAEALDLVDGDYVAEVYAGKSGTQQIKVAYDLTLDAVTGTRNITVTPGEVEGVQANGGKEITVKEGSVTGPYVIELVDRFGNPASSGTTQVITWEVDGGSIGFRRSASGGNVSELETRNKATVYLDVNEEGTYEITFYVDSYTGTLTVHVE